MNNVLIIYRAFWIQLWRNYSWLWGFRAILRHHSCHSNFNAISYLRLGRVKIPSCSPVLAVYFISDSCGHGPLALVSMFGWFLEVLRKEMRFLYNTILDDLVSSVFLFRLLVRSLWLLGIISLGGFLLGIKLKDSFYTIGGLEKNVTVADNSFSAPVYQKWL